MSERSAADGRNEAKEWHCFTLEAGLHPRPSTAKHYTGLIRVGKVFFYPGLFIFIYLFILGISMDLKRPGGYSKSATYTETILF